MILVVGASGTVGSTVVRELIEAGAPVRVLSRDAARVGKLGGVELALGDLSRPATLPPAFAGVEKVFLVTTGPAPLEVAAIDAARTAGVRHLVKLSSMGFGPERDALGIGNWHRAVEAHLAASGMAWTVLLAGGFASNALGWAPTLRAQGMAFGATGEGQVAVVDPRDLGAVAARVLREPGHEGRRYELTGPEALGAAQQVALLGAAVGAPWRFVDVPPAAAREGMVQAGMPAPLAEAMLEVMAAIRAGRAATVTGDVERILGRTPRTFATWARDHAGAFA
jgi:(4-alkanoyl-5-oxo-2,5-dihydrofuran-3-yl)methyl phosphate reductase